MSDRYNPMVELLSTRMKLFFREPEAIFWTYGFPLLMVLGLGIAFRTKPQETIQFDVVKGRAAEWVTQSLIDDKRFQIKAYEEDEALARLSKNKTPVVVAVTQEGEYEYHFDATNPDSRAARTAIDDALQRAAGRSDAVPTLDRKVTAPGSRYIDFLVPGLIGMNLMGGGLWGMGFVLVDMRVRNLLKRLVATPMKRSHFLLSFLGGRVLFFLPEMLVLVIGAYLIFQVPVRGSILSLTIVALVGALAFAGLGLLCACRAQRIETISGLMNVVMLPMWLMSGIFFSSERFPDFLQPFIRALPLTQLNDALRAVMLEQASLASQAVPVLILALWGGVSFVFALKYFRWV